MGCVSWVGSKETHQVCDHACVLKRVAGDTFDQVVVEKQVSEVGATVKQLQMLYPLFVHLEVRDALQKMLERFPRAWPLLR